MKLTRLLRRSSAALFLTLLTSLSAQDLRLAPNGGAAAANQLAVSGNACGPASLLSAFRFGDEKWQAVAASIQGETDRQKLFTIIREIAMRPSKSLGGRPRWSKSGVNVADLCDMANEMAAGRYLPPVRYEVLFLKPRESQEDLLERVHARLEKSLAKGLPPLLSIRRFAHRKDGWQPVEGHFVTIISMPRKLDKNARSFPVTYIDPWGAKRCEGQVAISDKAFLSGKADQPVDPTLSPCLEALFPEAQIGKSKLNGDATVLTVAAAIGRW